MRDKYDSCKASPLQTSFLGTKPIIYIPIWVLRVDDDEDVDDVMMLMKAITKT